MSEEEPGYGSGLQHSPLAPQLGSDIKDLGKGKFDMRRLSIIKEDDMGFLLYAGIKGRKSQVWRDLREDFLNLKISLNGRGRRDIIRMESVSKGGVADVESEIIRPGMIARNVYDRNWEERQRTEKGA